MARVWTSYRVNCPISYIRNKIAGKAVKTALVICMINADEFAHFVKRRLNDDKESMFTEKTVSTTVMLKRYTVEALISMVQSFYVEVESKSKLLSLALEFAANEKSREFETLLYYFF